jgi:spore coat polysaccharide biosynthesis predicted glycosyltransferase SpsG
MASRTSLRVLFAAAAGPRIGFGHLVRCRSLARALGVVPLVAVRGTTATRRRAASLGWRVTTIQSDGDLQRLEPQLLVVDDPSAAAVAAWVGRARRAGVPAATVHDLGIAAVESDLLIDGSVRPSRANGRCGSLRGPAYAVLDPRVGLARERGVRPVPRRVLIALGGGGRSRAAARLAGAIASRSTNVEIRIAGGFTARPHEARLPNATWIDVPDGLAEELASASVAIVAGGLTLYEACALGVPAVAVALNRLQHMTIRAVARHGAASDAGAVRSATARAALEVDRLLRDAASRRRMGMAGQALVDGRGAARVAARLRQLPAVMAGRVRRVA